MKKILWLCIVVFAIGACTKSIIDTQKSDFVVTTGTVCGWCSQNDTLTIDGNKIRYVNFKQCNNTNPSVSKTGMLDQSSLEKLSLVDFEAFKMIELNSCNVCFDGCDDWITIKNGSETHTIRFSRNDPKLQPVKAFVDQLSAIKATYESGN